MSQLFNPIQGKLSKMRSSQMLRCVTQPDTTPLKPDIFPDNDKQNSSLCPFTQHSKQTQHCKNADQSLKKLTLLQRRSINKENSINFYRNQLSRRKQKYQSQLQNEEQKYEKQLNSLEEQLIKKMKEEQEFDEQNQILTGILENVGENKWQFAGLDKLNDAILQILEEKLKKLGVASCQLLYSKQTIIQNKSIDKVLLTRLTPTTQMATNRKLRLTTRSQIYENQQCVNLSKNKKINAYAGKDNFSFQF